MIEVTFIQRCDFESVINILDVQCIPRKGELVLFPKEVEEEGDEKFTVYFVENVVHVYSELEDNIVYVCLIPKDEYEKLIKRKEIKGDIENGS